MSRFVGVSDLNREVRHCGVLTAPGGAHVWRQIGVPQLMHHLPWKSFGRIVQRYGGYATSAGGALNLMMAQRKGPGAGKS